MSHQPCSQLTRTPQNVSHTHNTHHHHTPSRDVEVPLKKTQSPQCAASSLAPPKATRGPQKHEQNVQSPKMGLLWTAVSVRDHPKTSAVAPLQPERAKRMCTRKRTEKTQSEPAQPMCTRCSHNWTSSPTSNVTRTTLLLDVRLCVARDFCFALPIFGPRQGPAPRRCVPPSWSCLTPPLAPLWCRVLTRVALVLFLASTLYLLRR